MILFLSQKSLLPLIKQKIAVKNMVTQASLRDKWTAMNMCKTLNYDSNREWIKATSNARLAQVMSGSQ